tara:strand:- start:48 stop:428 length:381 start_codon:yes stop_codon:yes gene_type:complete
MKIFLTFFVLFFSSSLFADEYHLNCVSDKSFMIVFSVDETNQKITHMLSKDLDTGQEWEQINDYHYLIFWEDKLVITLSKWEGSHTVNSFDLKNSIFISSGHYFNRSLPFKENDYTFNQFFECSKF